MKDAIFLHGSFLCEILASDLIFQSSPRNLMLCVNPFPAMNCRADWRKQFAKLFYIGFTIRTGDWQIPSGNQSRGNLGICFRIAMIIVYISPAILKANSKMLS